jgi:hypothetical protein
MATLEQIEAALRKADAAGNVDDARMLAQAYREMKGKTVNEIAATYPKQEPQLDDPSFLVGMGKRFNEAARGLGFDGVEPYAPADKRIDDSTAGMLGGVAADMALTAPAGLAGGALKRIVGTGLTEALTNKDNRVENAVTGAVGAGMGEALGSALKFAVNPFKNAANPIKDDLIAKASAMGIPLNAAQQTGNKALQYMDSALDAIPSSAAFQQEQKDLQRKAWQKALFAQGGENADGATSDVMGAMKDRISKSYNSIHGRNNLIIDQELKDALLKVEQGQLSRLPTNQKPVIQSYLDDFGALNIGDKMTGKQYQDLRSMIDKQAKGFKNSDPFTSDALKSIRGATDSAMARNLSGFDKPLLKKANNDWATMKSMERAIDPTTGNVSPALLINGLKKQDANRVLYGKGNQDLTDIAKVGKEFISSKVPDSGTAQRAAMMSMLKGTALAGAGADFAVDQDPTDITGLLAAPILAATIPKAAAKAMWKKGGGYLSKGLLDLNKEVVPGLTRGGILEFATRNAGLQAGKALRD